jgi:hypothetical protein
LIAESCQGKSRYMLDFKGGRSFGEEQAFSASTTFANGLLEITLIRSTSIFVIGIFSPQSTIDNGAHKNPVPFALNYG